MGERARGQGAEEACVADGTWQMERGRLREIAADCVSHKKKVLATKRVRFCNSLQDFSQDSTRVIHPSHLSIDLLTTNQ